MQSVVGIFATRGAADLAVQGLLATPISPQSITLLSGEAGKSQVASLATTDAERDGMGEAVGGVVGGAVGASAGLSLGSAIASLLVPGVGTIFAIGLGAAALLGLGGAAAGASLGEASEQAADIGVPKDDTFLYRELLKRGRSLVIANVDDPGLASVAKAVFERQGSEDIDEARKMMASAA
jgi:phage-related tail protein